jgi:hypothetical protein
VLLMVGLVVAIALVKGISAYKTYRINRSLKIGQVNFELEPNADPGALWHVSATKHVCGKQYLNYNYLYLTFLLAGV